MDSLEIIFERFVRMNKLLIRKANEKLLVLITSCNCVAQSVTKFRLP